MQFFANLVDLTEVFILTSHIEKKKSMKLTFHTFHIVEITEMYVCTLTHFWQKFRESNCLILQNKLI